MARLKAANNAQSLLSANITASATSLTVADGSVFPEPPFLITIDDEIIEVGTKTGNTFSGLLRGQEGTVATPHSSGAIVENRMTAGSYNELATQQQFNELQNTVVAHLAETVQDETPPHGLGTIASSNIEDFIKSTLTNISGVTDWDTLTTTGFYFILNQSDDINAPWGGAYNSTVIVLSQGTFTVQLAFKFHSSMNAVYFRQKATASGWSPWAQLLPTLFGTGAPEGTVTALVGTMYINTSDNSIYIKQTGTGNTGWKRVTLA